MTKEEQNRAIAEACGWIFNEGQEPIWLHGRPPPLGQHDGPPNFLEDLNATMEACKLLAAKGWRCVANMGIDGTWECFFTKRRDSDCLSFIPQEGDHYGAGDTLALAIAEAFLWAVGKWKDSAPEKEDFDRNPPPQPPHMEP